MYTQRLTSIAIKHVYHEYNMNMMDFPASYVTLPMNVCPKNPDP